ncbi:MAG TPA: hypothetical protein VIW64_05030 [Pyrinomonadaceae bacterium]|jgi:hypothetical protein
MPYYDYVAEGLNQPLGVRMNLLLITALLVTAVPQAVQPVDPTFERLAKVERFAFGPVGYAGVMSSGEKDYRAMLARSSAMADFERLFSSGNLQAKCYALVGIRKLSPQRFKDLAQSLRSSTEQVATMQGCIIFRVLLGDVIKQIDAGKHSR